MCLGQFPCLSKISRPTGSKIIVAFPLSRPTDLSSPVCSGTFADVHVAETIQPSSAVCGTAQDDPELQIASSPCPMMPSPIFASTHTRTDGLHPRMQPTDKPVGVRAGPQGDAIFLLQGSRMI